MQRSHTSDVGGAAGLCSSDAATIVVPFHLQAHVACELLLLQASTPQRNDTQSIEPNVAAGAIPANANVHAIEPAQTTM
jgi:hypothetical protein